MANYTVSKTRIRAGIWEGLVEAADATATDDPKIDVQHDGRAIRSMSLTADGAGRWLLRISIPPDVLCDGVQVFTICDGGDENQPVLASFAIVTGEPLDDELVAEVALLRSELDMLKSAFRRHCLES